MAQTKEELQRQLELLELEKKAAVLRKEVAQAQKDAAEAVKSSIKASLPDYTSKPLAGSASIDDKLQIEVQTLAHRSVERAAAKVAALVEQDTRVERVIVHNADDVLALTAYRSVVVHVKSVTSELERILARPQAERETLLQFTPTAATAIIGALADVAAFFRSDVTLKGQPIAVDEAFLVSVFANAVGPRVTVLYPKIYASITDAPESSDFLRALSALMEQRARADARIAASGSGDATSPTIAYLKALLALADRLLTNTLLGEDKGGLALARLMKADATATALAQPGTYVLVLAISAAGGSNKVIQSIWRNARISHSGGCVLHFQLIDKEGAIRRSGSIRDYSGFVEFTTSENASPEIASAPVARAVEG